MSINLQNQNLKENNIKLKQQVKQAHDDNQFGISAYWTSFFRMSQLIKISQILMINHIF
ncbi:hypothetical protein pb186bvf_015314 [Paramecium bursaria]